MTENIGENSEDKIFVELKKEDEIPDFIYTDKEEQMRAKREKFLKIYDKDPEDYRQYFGVIENLYAPVGNFLGGFNLFVSGIENKITNENKQEVLNALQEFIEKWKKVQDVYDNINFDELSEETGKKWIEMMAPLVDKFSERIIAIKNTVEAEKDVGDEIEDALATMDAINAYRNQIGKLPAYLAYRDYGQYENSDTLPEDKFK